MTSFPLPFHESHDSFSHAAPVSSACRTALVSRSRMKSHARRSSKRDPPRATQEAHEAGGAHADASPPRKVPRGDGVETGEEQTAAGLDAANWSMFDAAELTGNNGGAFDTDPDAARRGEREEQSPPLPPPLPPPPQHEQEQQEQQPEEEERALKLHIHQAQPTKTLTSINPKPRTQDPKARTS